jgi:hypothetical protein
MSDCYINIRFGTRHFKIHKNRPYISFKVNHYHVNNVPDKWFEVYEFWN